MRFKDLTYANYKYNNLDLLRPSYARSRTRKKNY